VLVVEAVDDVDEVELAVEAVEVVELEVVVEDVVVVVVEVDVPLSTYSNAPISQAAPLPPRSVPMMSVWKA